MAWKLANAFPAKITVTDLNANGNEAVVEEAWNWRMRD